MNLQLHPVARFVGGPLSMATIEGLNKPGRHWVIYAGHNKFLICIEDDETALFKDELFDSPEQALARIEQEYSG